MQEWNMAKKYDRCSTSVCVAGSILQWIFANIAKFRRLEWAARQTKFCTTARKSI